MFPFNLLLEKYRQKKSLSDNFEPLFESKIEIKKALKNITRCSHCQFLIFDNYWTGEIENRKMKVCTTCGWKI